MGQRAFYIDVIAQVLQGGLSRESASELVARESAPRGASLGDDELLQRCEWTLRHLACTGCWPSEADLRALLVSLRARNAGEPGRRAETSANPVFVVTVRFRPGLSARVHPHGVYTGVVLRAEQEYATELRRLRKSERFRQMLRWFQVRVGHVAGQPYYVLRATRSVRFMRELRELVTSIPGS